jgi:hypothetical protein
MGAYRHDLEAAVSRIDVLEARLAETQAMLEAREAALRTRDAELRALELEMNEPAERSGPRLSLGLMTVGAAALLLSLGLSEAFDRADRAEGRYLDARERLEAERLESERALSALRLETARLERVVDALDEDDLASGVDAIDDGEDEADEPVLDGATADSRIAELIGAAREGAADVNDLRLLRALCRKEGREGCYRFSVERLRSERALGF